MAVISKDAIAIVSYSFNSKAPSPAAMGVAAVTYLRFKTLDYSKSIVVMNTLDYSEVVGIRSTRSDE
jgi:hypothetical protein